MTSLQFTFFLIAYIAYPQYFLTDILTGSPCGILPYKFVF